MASAVSPIHHPRGTRVRDGIDLPAVAGASPSSPAILAPVETLLLDVLQPALASSMNINAVSVLQSFITTHSVDPESSPGKFFLVLAAKVRLGQAENLLQLEAEVFATRPLPQETVGLYLYRLQSTVVAHDVATRSLTQPPVSLISFRH